MDQVINNLKQEYDVNHQQTDNSYEDQQSSNQ